MTEEMTLREEIIKIIDDTPSGMKQDYQKFFTDVLKDGSKEDQEVFAKQLGTAFVEKMVGQEAIDLILQNIVNAFWEEFEPEITAFCDYWKAIIPPEEELEKLSEDQFEAIADEFGSETEALFQNTMRKFTAKFKR